jgi:hypothetical protein
MPTGLISPTGTAANLLEETPGATFGQTQSLSGELAPVPAAIQGLISGANQYGTAYKGNQRVLGPIESDILSRFKPLGAAESLLQTKKGGTFVQNPEQAAFKFGGVPIEQLRNPTTTAGLGQKDFEQALSTPDKIRFQYEQAQNNFPAELQLFQKVSGQPLDPHVAARIKGDFDAIEQRDIFQYQYANSHQAKTWKALPPVNRLAGTLDWLAHHGYSNAQIAAAQRVGQHLTSDKEMDKLVNALWQSTGIGQAASKWKSVVKGMKPPTLTGSNG